MLTIKHEILTYKPYRIVCNLCLWESDTYELLSQVAKAMNEHNRSEHYPMRPVSDPPPKPVKLIQ